MLTQKEDELDRLKGRKTLPNQGSPDSPSRPSGNSFDLDSGYESTTTNSVIKKNTEIEREKIKETLNYDYVKNVFIKYLEY